MPIFPPGACALLAALTPAAARAQEVYEDQDLGVRLHLPASWSTAAAEPTSPLEIAQVAFVPHGAPAGVECRLRAFDSAEVGGPVGARAMARASVEDPSSYANALELEVELLGEPRPAFQVDVLLGGGDGTGSAVRLRQVYLGANELVYVFQSTAPVGDFADLLPSFAALWSGLELGPLGGELLARRRLAALAARCGSELDWADDWDAAAARARAEGKLVLVKLRAFPGFAISDEQLSGPFMDPDVVALVQECFVPFALGSDRDAPFAASDSYGLSPSTFGEAVLLATADGEVVEQAVHATLELLARAADAHGDEPSLLADCGPLERAELHLRRGELEVAEALLASSNEAAGLRLLARARRMRRDGAGALEALARARTAPGGSELAVDLDVDEALVRVRTGDAAEARALLEGVLAERADHARAPEARFLLGELLSAAGYRETAIAAWKPLVELQPESRWAWLAAARQTSTAFELGLTRRLDWPGDAEWAALHPAPRAPLLPEEAGRAACDARLFLTSHQRGDGGWIDPSFVERADREAAPHDFELAGAAIAGRALLLHGGADERAAAGRALEYCLGAQRRQLAAGAPPMLMDYSPWSRAFLLLFLADARAAGLESGARLAGAAGLAVAHLSARRRPGGGWSYYVSGSAHSAETDPHSISFVTAAVVLALLRAREAEWFVPPELIADGLDRLESTRAEPGLFEYMLMPGARARPGSVSPPGAAGRGPACALALLRGERADIDEVRAGLELLAAHRGGLAAEVGKALMHAGPDGQGAHYVLFDLALAAEAVLALPERERPRYALMLREELLRARRADGAFIDYLGIGPAASTGLALRALDLLDELDDSGAERRDRSAPGPGEGGQR